MSLTELISDHVSGFEPGALPAPTRHATRRALLDAVGVMLGASGISAEVQPFRRIAAREAGAGPARLIGGTARVPVQSAALANGALGHALDFGDVYDAGTAHPNAALVPALLALCDAEPQIDRDRLLSAMAIGSDLACRLSHTPLVPIEERGWYPPPLFGTLGAAAGCAHLLGLTPRETADAIGLAWCQVTFPAAIKYDGTSHVRAVREGFAARAAVAGALLAREGVAGFAAPLEGPGGFFATHVGGYDDAPLRDGLGRVFYGDRVSFKPWPSCRGTHAYIAATLDLRTRLGVPPEAIVAIEAVIGPVQEMLVEPRAAKIAPDSAIQAKFSIPFTVAYAWQHGRVDLESFDEAARADPAVLALAAKVTATRHPDWTRAHAAAGGLIVMLADGTRHESMVLAAPGGPESPLDDATLVAKFVACATRAAMPLAPAEAETLALRLLACGGRASAGTLLD